MSPSRNILNNLPSSRFVPQVYVWFSACWCIFSSASSWWTFFFFSLLPPTLFFLLFFSKELENSQNCIQLEQPPWGSHNSTKYKLLTNTIQATPWQLLFKQHLDSHHNNLLCIFKHSLPRQAAVKLTGEHFYNHNHHKTFILTDHSFSFGPPPPPPPTPSLPVILSTIRIYTVFWKGFYKNFKLLSDVSEFCWL